MNNQRYNFILTTAGRNLYSQCMANAGSLKFISAKTGSGIHQESEELAEAVSLIQEKQTFPIDCISAKENEVHITFVIENESLTTGYTLTECGIYAKKEGAAQQILFAIGIPTDDILIPGTSDSEYYGISEICEFIITTSNADAISVEVPEQAHVLKSEFIAECKKNQSFIEENTLNVSSGDLSKWLKNIVNYDFSSIIYSETLKAFVATGNIITEDGEKGRACFIKSKDLTNWEDVVETSTSPVAMSYRKCIEKGNDIYIIGALQNAYGKYPYLGWYKNGLLEGTIMNITTVVGNTAIEFLEDNIYVASKEGLFVLEAEDTQLQAVYSSTNFPSADMYIEENLCICVGGNSVMVSTDFVNFEKKTLSQMTEITKILKVSDMYIVLGEGNFMAKSHDGYNWEYVSCYTSEKIIDAVLYKNMILGISTNYLYPINLKGNLDNTYNERVKVTDSQMRSLTYSNGLLVSAGYKNSNICKWKIFSNLKDALFDTGWMSDGVEHNISDAYGPPDSHPINYRRIGNRVELRGRLYSMSKSGTVRIPIFMAPSKQFSVSKVNITSSGVTTIDSLLFKPDGSIVFSRGLIGGELSHPVTLDFGNISWYTD